MVCDFVLQGVNPTNLSKIAAHRSQLCYALLEGCLRVEIRASAASMVKEQMVLIFSAFRKLPTLQMDAPLHNPHWLILTAL